MNWNQRSSTMLEERFRVADSVVATEQAGAAILLDLRSGHYYTMNAVSAVIWSALEDDRND